MTYKKKLIEVALPLEAINKEAAREKSIRHGHPSTLHLWWARRPLAACRAVLFSQLVDDPSAHPDQFPTEEAQEAERQRLFRIIEELVKWDNVNNETVLEAARAEIRKSCDGNPPPVYDPFCGGGPIPMEAQRLGLKAYASDLNPVAVLITKALIEIPPKFAGKPPVNPTSRSELAHSGGWKGAQGLAEDVRYYGKWMRDEAEKRIGHLYPKVKLPKEQGGGEATVIAWLWARTVKCPNPACGAQMPLVRSFALSTKKGKEVHVEPVVDKVIKTVRFEVKVGGKVPDGTVNRRGAQCIVCDSPVPFDHVREECRTGRMSAQLLAIVAEGTGGRNYVSPLLEHETVASISIPPSAPDTDLPTVALGFRVQRYGMTKHRDLFTPRQLVALTTFSDLVGEARQKASADAMAAGMPNDEIPLERDGSGATAYGDAVAVYLAFGVSQLTRYSCTLTPWNTINQNVAQAFGRQALPMVWDFAECNTVKGVLDISSTTNWVCTALSGLPAQPHGTSFQMNVSAISKLDGVMIATDPPYYDNIGYADLSDFFYAWLRLSLFKVYPQLLATILVPKAEELVAEPFRHGGRDKARSFFELGIGNAFEKMRKTHDASYPLAIYYAFKQAESETDSTEHSETTASTGWETFLNGIIEAGWGVVGTWPMRTEDPARLRVQNSNALASSIVLVCRSRPEDAPFTARRDFLAILKRDLPDALRKLQQGNIAPVDLAQAAIGPGMAVFTRYSKVIEADGSAMSVHTALGLINQALEEYLTELEGEMDGDTRWALAWFEQHSMDDGPFGDAETLCKAKNTSVSGLVEAGFLRAKAGKVRLLKRDELPEDWDPAKDHRLTVWEMVQHLIRELESAGESTAAALLAKLGGKADAARDLAYRLYNICDRKKWTGEALAYNGLVVAWPELARLAQRAPKREAQDRLL